MRSSGPGLIVVTECSDNIDSEADMPVLQTMENDVPSVITDTQGDGGEGVGGSRGAPDYVELPDEDGGRD